MKEITKMSRLTGQLEKCFRLLNDSFFDSVLPMPVITVIPSSRSYAHYTPYDAWNTKNGARREINIASGTLDRPLENIISSLLHEMCHEYNDVILNVADTSRCGTYHNKYFAKTATEHALICSRSDKYGWSHTAPSDCLIEFILEHDELREIEMCRINPCQPTTSIGTHSNSEIGNALITSKRNHVRRYECPCCHTVIRATKKINIICGDCMTAYVEG